MLDTLRANSRSVLSYIIFGILIVVFVAYFGPGSRGCTGTVRSATWAAKVNGETVSPAEYERVVRQLDRMYGSQLGGDETQRSFLQARLRQMAMEQAVERELLDQEAARQGIVVSDSEVSAAIKKDPSFRRKEGSGPGGSAPEGEGEFDIDLYRRVASGEFGSPARFEDWMRRVLATRQLLSLVQGEVRLTDDEVRDAWLAENDRVDVEFARFPLAAARADVTPTDAQVQEFIAKEGPRIEAYYKGHQARFHKPKQVRARHILVKVPASASEKQQDAAKKRIEEVAQRLKKGEDFAKVAREASEDPGSKEKGGELGFFGQGVMAKPFEDQAFKMKSGENSPPVKTDFGWHLIQVEEVREPEVVPLDKARPEIARELVEDDLAKALASREARETLERLKAGKTFAEALPAEGKATGGPVKLGGKVVNPEDTGSFTANAAPNIPRLGPLPQLFAAALRASAGEVLPQVFDSPAGPLVARVKERQRPEPGDFAKAKSGVEMRLRLRRQAEVEQAFVEDLRKKAKVELNQALVLGTVRGGARGDED